MRSQLARLITCLLVVSLSGQATAQFRDAAEEGGRFIGPLTGLGAGPELGDPVSISANFVAATADRPAVLMITADIESGWHVYSTTQPSGGPQKTQIELTPSAKYRVLAPFRSHPVPRSHIDEVAWVGLEIQEHENQVTWYTPIELSSGVDPSTLEIRGVIHGQACKDACIPLKLPFTATIGTDVPRGLTLLDSPTGTSETSVDEEVAGVTLDRTAAAEAANASSSAAATKARDAEATVPMASDADEYDLDQIILYESKRTLAYYVLLAFAGGLILNMMPCVLPVIGLKVMSFVGQAGHSRRHALVLNIWYSAGIVSVFLVLGLLATWVGLAWGGQFGSTAFNVTLAAVVFAMALSLLGVWEIPIPGFFGSGTAQDLATKEGPLGAFSKGVVTTVLATPCTGPFMATAIAWAVRQPTFTTMTVFASLGFGMASPYLIVGVFPQLLRFLPKPGPWMVIFKQLMGFVLLGTVVFILSFMNPAALVPTAAVLVGIGLVCWLVSQTPLTADISDRLQTWALAGAVVLLFGVGSFGWLYPEVTQPQAPHLAASPGTETAWQPFSLAELKRTAVDQGRTVLIDFSAEWCLTCKTLEKTVLHTEAVEQAIASAGVVTMYADFTDYPPHVDRTIRALRSNGVPVIAIFPGERPYEPIVFRGAYSKGDILEAIAVATGGAVARLESLARIGRSHAVATR